MSRMDANSGLDRGLMKSVDWRLVGCWLILAVFGLMNIYAAVRSQNPSGIFDLSCNSGKQALWIGISFAFALFILFVVNTRVWEVISVPLYGVVVVLLVAVIFMSTATKGSHSWFSLGPVKFQPAEVSKITTSLVLAGYMGRPNFKLDLPRDFWTVALIIGLPMLIIVAEDETGSALVYVGFLFVLYREGLSGWYLFMLFMAILLFILALTTNWWIAGSVLLAACAGYFLKVLRETRGESRKRRRALRNSLLAFAAGMVLIFAAGFAFNHVLKDYQRGRIEVLLGMKEDIRGAGYNVHQSMIAIGSGGFGGKGYLNGTQTTYGFVPEQHTDFIFCTVGEEWGFLGCLFVILVYGLMIAWIIGDAEKARSSFARIYGYCLASCLFMHLFINIGMTIGLMPVIGIPLPLFSYGGSSMLAFTTMIFIFIALDRQEKKYF